jgi:hypothetical protein
MLKFSQKTLMCAALATAAWSVHAQTPTATATKVVSLQRAPAMEDVFPQTLKLGDRTTRLNGVGTRYKAVFRVYRAALYAERPVQALQDLSDPNQAKRIQLVMLREVNSSELSTLFVRGIQQNLDKAASTHWVSAMVNMAEMFSRYKRVEAGDQITLDWLPGKGTVITVRGEAAGTPIPDAAFYQALASIWLGTSPADWTLREAMLGKQTQTASAVNTQ